MEEADPEHKGIDGRKLNMAWFTVAGKSTDFLSMLCLVWLLFQVKCVDRWWEEGGIEVFREMPMLEH